MKKTPLNLWFCFHVICLLLLFAGNTLAETALEATTRLQNRYDTIESLTFDFVQNTKGQLAGRPKTGRGHAYFVKKPLPAKMRWDYFDPEKQVLVSDGVTFSMYFESLQQMIINPATALTKDLTYSFFTGTGNLLEDFTITEAEDQITTPETKTVVAKLTPKAKQSQVAAITLWITEDSLIRRIEIRDLFDTITVLNFSNLQVNTLDSGDTAMLSRLFTFTPPENTEIIQQ